ncbi:MAG: hypothetical protein KM310_03145 [Clostridiales bacterium]|nr:hypothetical protein [Clostridiales bacterium]
MRPGVRELALIAIWVLAAGSAVGLFLKALGLHEFWVLLGYPVAMRLFGDGAAGRLFPGRQLRTRRPLGDEILAVLHWGFPLAVVQRLLAGILPAGPVLWVVTSPLPAALGYLIDLYPRWQADMARATLADRLGSWP